MRVYLVTYEIEVSAPSAETAMHLAIRAGDTLGSWRQWTVSDGEKVWTTDRMKPETLREASSEYEPR